MNSSAISTAAIGEDYLSLKAQIIDLYAAIHLASYQLLKLIQALDEQNLAVHNGFISTSAWLGFYLGIGPNAAREKVRVARAISNLPLIDAAFANGRLSYSKVRALTRVATADNEARFLHLARHATAHQVERIVRDHLQVERGTRIQAGHPELQLYKSDNGWTLKGSLPDEMGALLQKALAHYLESEQSAADDMPIAECRAHALLDLVDSGRDAHNKTTSSAERYLVHIEHDDHRLSDSAREKLTCDASTVLHTSENGAPLNVGRKSRTVPPALRRALHRRDKGCRFPGCTHTRFVDAHHVHHWKNGGETRLDNLILLCRRHHTYIHDRRAFVSVKKPMKGAAQFHFYDADGSQLLATGEACLEHAKVQAIQPQRVAEVTAVTSSDVSPFAPINPTGSPDYHEIARYLQQSRE